MDIKIPVTDIEKSVVIDVIKELDAIPHLKYMSQEQIAQHAGMKVTKVRAILIELLTEKKITQYQATENPRLQRFYYIVNDSKPTGDEQ